MRRRLPWLCALPVMAAGSLAAHSLSYTFVSARAAEHGPEASERASSGSASDLVLLIGMLAALAAAVVVFALARRRRRGVGASPWLFFVLPPLAFASQELAERLLHAEAFPFQATLETRFLLGLLLQLPFGLLALLVARALLRVVERLVLALGAERPLRLRTSVSWSLPDPVVLPRIPALALGYPQRGPPTP
jgi:hypothetical protein